MSYTLTLSPQEQEDLVPVVEVMSLPLAAKLLEQSMPQWFSWPEGQEEGSFTYELDDRDALDFMDAITKAFPGGSDSAPAGVVAVADRLGTQAANQIIPGLGDLMFAALVK